jgi:hypothetical protein
MRDSLVVLMSAPFMLAILLPVLATYVLTLMVYVAVANPLGHVYRIARYGIQSPAAEPL